MKHAMKPDEGNGYSRTVRLHGVWQRRGGRWMKSRKSAVQDALQNLLQILLSNRPFQPSIQKAVIASFFKPLASV